MKKIILLKRSSSMIQKIIFFVLFISILFWFYKVNEWNYYKHKIIKENLIKHPENLPTKETAINTSFWYKNLKADIYWLETIQYIWWNAISSEYKKYLYVILDLITELNPFFEHPYTIWQILLPSHNKRYGNISEKEQEKYEDQWIKIWLKWINNFCDQEKIKLIKKEDNLTSLWTEEKYKNPCKTYKVPYYLAYIYFFYKKNHLEASSFYKIASANENSLEWSKIMAAIMQWKWWNREKSYFMFLNMAKFTDSEDEVCINFASELEKIWKWLFIDKNIKLNWEIIKFIWENRNKLFWDFTKEDEKKAIYNTECVNFVNKSTRELNLSYLEYWNKKFKKNNKWISAKSINELYKNWNIDYIPKDFQQYENYWIIYYYNPDTKGFDYKMGYED